MAQGRIRKQWASCTPSPDSVAYVKALGAAHGMSQGRVVDDLVEFARASDYRPGKHPRKAPKHRAPVTVVKEITVGEAMQRGLMTLEQVEAFCKEARARAKQMNDVFAREKATTQGAGRQSELAVTEKEPTDAASE